ncbi:hypothetical protein TNIN_207571 [Trichonephila inaurata madagascariensis]|uniref:Uncharacterized protein n=1 Tax=Trichonephila inaurata madagascariensis TaxID=2747483 RepID=A0A8X6YTD6_9ARAC|nr:hypothetical protein TNIN_207571 [Trichonephila inaurata madagascariensis]
MSPLMSITGHSDSLDRSLRSEPPGYFFVGFGSAGSGSAFLADCWREPLHTLHDINARTRRQASTNLMAEIRKFKIYKSISRESFRVR